MNKTMNLNLILHFRFIYTQIFLFLINNYTIQMFEQNIIRFGSNIIYCNNMNKFDIHTILNQIDWTMYIMSNLCNNKLVN